ncbi:MAG: hypothetical protein KA267_07670 [Gemmatimonadales bacterium]|nr:hypothetical protein [Gemmatimonadales bacterium]MBP6570493.1 hypothetical protein [Gemmatimonadales bacterium]MBP7620292.1 hypothetical protein [Gemmatimonadales bacterium]
MAKDSCLECGKPFPPNKELASVPLARLVAFDPDANRVWRICEPCAHWNLLGPEAARAATPELLARSEAAVSAGDMGLGLVATESGSLLLFRVGAVASQDAVALKAAEIHAVMKDGHNVTWESLKPLLVVFAVCGAGIWVLEQFAITATVLHSDSLRALYYSLFVARFALAGKEIFRRDPKVLRWLGIIMIPVLISDFAMSDEPLWLVLAGAAVGTWLGLRLGRREGAPRGIRWRDGTDQITYHEGVLGDHAGWVATTLAVQELLRDFVKRVDQKDRDAAWERWRAHRSLASLLTAFEAKRDSTGLLRFSEMELCERLALLVAIGARLAEPPAEVVAGLDEAERVAAIAESLDRQLAEPA